MLYISRCSITIIHPSRLPREWNWQRDACTHACTPSITITCGPFACESIKPCDRIAGVLSSGGRNRAQPHASAMHTRAPPEICISYPCDLLISGPSMAAAAAAAAVQLNDNTVIRMSSACVDDAGARGLRSIDLFPLMSWHPPRANPHSHRKSCINQPQNVHACVFIQIPGSTGPKSTTCQQINRPYPAGNGALVWPTPRCADCVCVAISPSRWATGRETM